MGGVEAVVRQRAAGGLRFGDVQAVRRDGRVHDRLVQAGLAVAALDQGEEPARLGEQMATVEEAVAAHHEHHRADAESRQGDIQGLGDLGADRGDGGPGPLQQAFDEVRGLPEELLRAPRQSVRSCARERASGFGGRVFLAAIRFSFVRACSDTTGPKRRLPSRRRW
ncbi:hypothetical protein ACFY5H_26295 [Streptomyces sp. NPDC013012]|uniref:hypothetical protein n=1 Tax=Streptomyces sp. NPDC013012 TaxID=3364860 RepID=UPI0036BD075F